MKIHGRITDGMFSNMRELYRQFKLLEGERVTVSIAKQKVARTNAQNNYLFGVVYPAIMDWMGETDKDYVHNQIEDLTKLRIYVDDRGMRYIKKTSDMSVDELSAYIEAVKLWAWHNHNVFIPEPQCG